MLEAVDVLGLKPTVQRLCLRRLLLTLACPAMLVA